MTVDRPHNYLLSVLRELRKMPTETEGVEFKQNIAGPDDIGEYISAALLGKVNAWMVWGLNNSILRQRFGIDAKNSATASRMIRESIEAKLIRPYDESASKKFMKYIPFWA